VTFARYYNPTAEITIVGNRVNFADGLGLNVKCTIERSFESEPDRCSVAIEGLDPVRARLMGQIFRELPDSPVNTMTVAIGYDAIAVPAFTGRLESFTDSTQVGPETWTYATAGDGADAYDTDKIVEAKATQAPVATQVRYAIAVLGLVEGPSVTPVINSVDPAAQGPFNQSGARTAADLLDNACRTLRCRWYIRDGMVHLVRQGLPDPSARAVVIAPQQPGPRFPGAPLVEPVTFGGGGIMKCATFLDPGIVPGGQVSYQGGMFRVEHVVHSFETRGAAPWVSRIVGRSL